MYNTLTAYRSASLLSIPALYLPLELLSSPAPPPTPSLITDIGHVSIFSTVNWVITFLQDHFLTASLGYSRCFDKNYNISADNPL
ncbi:MAG: hypothetical protein IPM04_09850 [Saprospiraceae bacterium]|nr:hypothetical protein [Candidatus Brachybacter algidus]